VAEARYTGPEMLTTTAVDIYSLSLTAYELLVGRPDEGRGVQRSPADCVDEEECAREDWPRLGSRSKRAGFLRHDSRATSRDRIQAHPGSGPAESRSSLHSSTSRCPSTGASWVIESRSTSAMDGIIAHLARECRENVHNGNVIVVRDIP
jgi:hypothetical protein